MGTPIAGWFVPWKKHPPKNGICGVQPVGKSLHTGVASPEWNLEFL